MQHDKTSPCNECPFRKEAPPGWLGPWNPEQLVDIYGVGDGEFPCHKTVKESGVSDPRQQQCAGILIMSNNSCKLPRDPERSAMAKRLGKSDDVFGRPHEFVEHHRSTGVVSGDVVSRTSGRPVPDEELQARRLVKADELRDEIAELSDEIDGMDEDSEEADDALCRLADLNYELSQL